MQVIDGFAVLEHVSAKLENGARSSQKPTSCLPSDYPTDNATQHRCQPSDEEDGFNGQIVVSDVDTGAKEYHLTESVDSDAAEHRKKKKGYVVERGTLRAKMWMNMDSEDAKIVEGGVAGVNLRKGGVSMEMSMDRKNGRMW